MSTISHKTVKLLIQTGEPLDLSKLAKKESMDNVQRWITSIAHTVKMIDFHQQEYKLLHERHLSGKLSSDERERSYTCFRRRTTDHLFSCVVAVKNTNKKVKMWSFIECLAVMGVSGLQVLFIKRMFNKPGPGVRRMV